MGSRHPQNSSSLELLRFLFLNYCSDMPTGTPMYRRGELKHKHTCSNIYRGAKRTKEEADSIGHRRHPQNLPRIRVRNSPRVRGRIRSKCLEHRCHRRHHPQNSLGLGTRQELWLEPLSTIISSANKWPRTVMSPLELAKDDGFPPQKSVTEASIPLH